MHLLARVLITVVCLIVPGLVEARQTTSRVSEGSGGTQANSYSSSATISADGRWVAFHSNASNLVASDTNGADDVFLHDRQSGITTRVSVATGGAQGNGHSGGPAISGDGRWIAYHSAASNLVAGDTNGEYDVFVHDRLTGTTTRVSVGPGAAQANEQSSNPAISVDGRWVAFHSEASNLVVGDSNGVFDVFLYDRQTGTTSRVSVTSGGGQGNDDSFTAAVSADGRSVAFWSFASNLVTDDTNARSDVFVHDRQTGATTRVSIGSGGVQGNAGGLSPSISADGRWVAFDSFSDNLVAGDTNGTGDVFVHDRETGTTTRVSVGLGGGQGNEQSSNPSISADGRWVAFHSHASNLVAGDTNLERDVFVHERDAGTTTRVSVSTAGIEGNGPNTHPTISADGNFVALISSASNLVAVDTNGMADAFVRSRGAPGCSFALAPTSESLLAVPTTGTVTVLTSAECAWTADSNEPWLSVTSGANGSGVQTVTYDVAANPSSDARNGTLMIAGRLFTVTQASPTTPPAAAPLPPAGLVVHALVGNVVTLRWTIPPGGPPPTGFVLEGGVHPGEILASIPTASAAPAFTFTAPSGSFHVRLHALNGTTRSAASNEIQIHVNAPITPSAPAGLLGLVNGSTLALTWSNTYEGGAPTSLFLDVSGTIVASLPLGVAESFSFANVPAGTYMLAVRSQNAGGIGPPSNTVTLTFPGACSGPPLAATNVLAYRVGNTVLVDWTPAASGPAPTSYVLNVTGSFVGSFLTEARAMSGTVGPGSYTISVVASNVCGESAPSAAQTVVVP